MAKPKDLPLSITICQDCRRQWQACNDPFLWQILDTLQFLTELSVYCIDLYTVYIFIYIYVYIVYIIIYIHNSNNNNYRSFYLLYIVLYCVYIYIDVHNYGSRLSSTKVASQAISNTALGSSRLWRVWPGASQKSSLRISSNGGVSFGQRILQPASQVSQVASQTASCKSCTGHATHRQSSPWWRV